MAKKLFDSVMMLRFCKTKLAKEDFYGAKRKKQWDVDVDNIVFSKIIKKRKNKF